MLLRNNCIVQHHIITPVVSLATFSSASFLRRSHNRCGTSRVRQECDKTGQPGSASSAAAKYPELSNRHAEHRSPFDHQPLQGETKMKNEKKRQNKIRLID